MRLKFDVIKNAEAGWLEVYREDGDKTFYNESTLLHHIKLRLISMGYDVIKKLMWKDGHMIAETQHYIRSRRVDKNPDAMYIHDSIYAIRLLHQDFNENGYVGLEIVFPNRGN